MSLAPSHRALTAGAAVAVSAALVTGLQALPAEADSLTTRAVADSWVDSGHPSVNHGSSTYLQVDASPRLRAYLKFTVSVPAGQTVSKAVLTVTPNQSSSGGFVVESAGNSWTESGITWSNAPAPGSTSYAKSGAVTAGTAVHLDVTRAVPTGGGTVTLVLDNATVTSYSVRSREQSSAAPQLAVTTATTTSSSPAPTTSPTPISSPTPTSSATPTASPTPTSTSSSTSTTRSLAWSPPAMSNPVTHHVGGTAGATYSAPTGQDTIIAFDSPVTTRLNLSGGHNWLIVGGEININGSCATSDACNGLTVSGANGVIYVEGLYMHGSTLNDGFKGNSPNATWIMQNSLINGVHGTQSTYHSDCWQPYGGFQHFFMDYVTCYTTMQGGMIKSDGPVPWGDTDWRNVNIVGFNDVDGWPINVILGCCNRYGVAYTKGPIHTSGLYLLPDPNHNGGTLSGNMAPSADFTFAKNSSGQQVSATWNSSAITFTGTITKGRPATGDYVTPTMVGMGYRAI